MTTNPYAATKTGTDESDFVRRTEIMTVGKAMGTIALSALVCGLAGGAVGLLIATALPDYYRAVFPAARDPSINMHKVAAALGLMQGLGAGLVVGLALVLILCWYRSRMIRQARC